MRRGQPFLDIRDDLMGKGMPGLNWIEMKGFCEKRGGAFPLGSEPARKKIPRLTGVFF
jgi:hypothetical protein